MLQVGGTGRVGGMIVRRLSEQGVLVRCLARSLDSESATALRALTNVEVMQGDVTDAASVTAAMAGCCKCVACFGAQRLTKLSDLWMDSTQDPAHPYQINYMGVANLVEAAKATPGFQKMVRVTGLSVGYSAFDKIAVLLNLVLSLTIRYQTMGERVIRDSGIDYTIIRPGNMKEPRPEGAQLRLSAGTGVRNHPVGKVLRQDVADLCVAALSHPGASNATLGCTWTSSGEDSCVDPLVVAGDRWEALLDSIGQPDSTPLEEKPHRLAVGVVLACMAAVVAFVVAMVVKAFLL